MKKFLILLSLIFFISCSENNTFQYVASTSWVASIAQIAGLDEIKTIAPSNLKHPPEYEITASDVLQVANAQLFMHAGYEVMMKTISESSGIDKNKIIKVRTDNSIQNIEKEVEKIVNITGTQEEAKIRFGKYKKLIEDAKEELLIKDISKIKFYVQKDQVPLAKDLGLNICGVYSGKSLGSEEILEISKNNYDVIIENFHNQIIFSVDEYNVKTKIVVWKNFPEEIQKDSLYNLVKENITSLFKVLDL